jgi:putative ABC transport system ATP-binding protein
MKKTNEMSPIAKLSGVTKIFHSGAQEAVILKEINFEAKAGELVLLLGPSGSGKSTFLTILAGLQAPSSGEVWLFGKELQNYSEAELQALRANRIGFVFQTFHLIDALTGLENIQLVMKFVKTASHESRSRAEVLLERLGISYLRNAYPRTMSQGEKQRVAVARALANNAALIIADEPTGSLSTEQGMDIVKLLQEMTRLEKRCVVIASHDQRISQFADRVFHLQDGEIVNLASQV